MARQSSSPKAEEEAIEKNAKEKAIERKAKRKAKKRTASTHEPSDRPRKVHKKTPSPHVEEGAEIVKPSFHKTPTTKRTASHSGLIKQGTTIYASNMEDQIAAEARRVTRKNIPWDKFRSIYLCDFSGEAQPKLAVESVKKIGDGNWEEILFWNRLSQALSDEVRCSGCSFMSLSPLLTY
jgi:hypothetical protein